MAENLRRKFSPEEKGKAVRRLMRGAPPQEVADDFGATLSQVMRWETRFLEAGDMAMTKSSRRTSNWGKFAQWAGVFAALVLSVILLTRFWGQQG